MSFQQIIWADTDHVGCGAADCPDDRLGGIYGDPPAESRFTLFVCEYGPA